MADGDNDESIFLLLRYSNTFKKKKKRSRRSEFAIKSETVVVYWKRHVVRIRKSHPRDPAAFRTCRSNGALETWLLQVGNGYATYRKLDAHNAQKRPVFRKTRVRLDSVTGVTPLPPADITRIRPEKKLSFRWRHALARGRTDERNNNRNRRKTTAIDCTRFFVSNLNVPHSVAAVLIASTSCT